MPESASRVKRSTPAETNARIRKEMLQRLYYYQHHLEEIDERLQELDREWDIERALEANASTVMFSSVLLSSRYGAKPLLLAGTVAGFLLQHALQGWCPPLPLLRRLGFRTAREIETERQALRILRGDLDDIDSEVRPERALGAAEGRSTSSFLVDKHQSASRADRTI